MPTSSEFDVFLSHNSTDKPTVRQLAGALKGRGLKVWLDECELIPGRPWQEAIEEVIQTTKSAVVVVGADGLGPWEIPEMRGCLSEFVKRRLPVIPVLLPGAPNQPDLPLFLKQFTWVDLRGGLTEDGLKRLEWGITGRKPDTHHADFKEDLGRVLKHAGAEPIGRDEWFPRLDAAALDPAVRIVSLIAFGGVGKTTLVAHWLSRLTADNWRVGKTGQHPGVPFDRVFGWSFYSQGTRDDAAASADQFIAQALIFFGDAPLAASNTGPWDKGVRLAQLVAERPSLLVLDGIEPLQHPPGPLAGRLKDPGLEALLTTLAGSRKQSFAGSLCVITSRESVAELVPFHYTTAREYQLELLSDAAGAEVLHRAGATQAGAVRIPSTDPELLIASREVAGHALTLQLLGGYLRLAAKGDILRRKEIHLSDADPEYKTNPADADKPYGHAFKVMGAYAKWLASAGETGTRQLAVLRLMGLFDRPADPGCLGALRKAPAIAGLTDPLFKKTKGLLGFAKPGEPITDSEWNTTLTRLADGGLLFVRSPSDLHPSAFSPPPSLDAHPLLREYFTQQLRANNPDAWKAAQRRLYEHLRDSTKDKPQPTLDDLQPLYQAVAHGCKAGMEQHACEEVYLRRILRGNDFYSVRKLGAFGADLGAVACFFEQPWTVLSPSLTEVAQAWLLNEAATRLRALGRLTEALEPMRAGMEARVRLEQFDQAAMSANNLSELELELGEVAGAVRDAEQSVTYADRSGDAFLRMAFRTTLADALHQAGRRDEAEARFREAEGMQAKRQPEYPLLYSLAGFRYCDLLLAAPERAGWDGSQRSEVGGQKSELVAVCRAVEKRGAKMFEWRVPGDPLLDIGLDHLTLGRAALYRAILEQSEVRNAESEIEQAVAGLRRAGTQNELPRGLLTRAWLRFLKDDPVGARADLDEAWQIAERGSMRLFMADIHLHRARLFRDKGELAKARAMIERCKYWRRKEELEDAEEAAQSW